MRNRPGEHARLKIRAGWFRALRSNLSLWILLVLVVTVCLVVFALLPMPGAIRGFWIGFLVASALAGFVWMLQILSNTHGWSVGKLGEEATADAVASWRRRRQGWRLINGLYMGSHGDVDHVLVGPGGVFAIESKWTSRRCYIERATVKGLVGREPVSQARTNARNVEELLRHGLPHLDTTVRPVVVLWGSGRVRFEDGWSELNGVLVCDGPRKKLWLKRLDSQMMWRTEIEAIADVLEERLAQQTDQPVSNISSR